MAVKFRLYQGGDPEVLRFVEYLRSTGVIRHVDQKDLFSYDGMIAIPISQTLSERILLAFYMTTMKSLKGIAESGIILGEGEGGTGVAHSSVRSLRSESSKANPPSNGTSAESSTSAVTS